MDHREYLEYRQNYRNRKPVMQGEIIESSSSSDSDPTEDLTCSQKLQYYLDHGVNIYQILLISHQSPKYKVWLIIDKIACLTSGYLNLFVATFIEASNETVYNVTNALESLFMISFVLNFFVDYIPKGMTIPVRNPSQIALNYYNGPKFLLDVIPLIPL